MRALATNNLFRVGSSRPIGLLAICALVFCGGVAGTIYCDRSMCCEMGMPGGWVMSMMWMRMPGWTWAASAGLFLFMWLAMMWAMMLPSALPMLLHVRRSFSESGDRRPGMSVALVASGYFLVWLLVGAAVYAAGVTLALGAMRWEWFSRLVPALSGAALISAGAMQFARWKWAALQRCRDPLGCRVLSNCNALKAGWEFGLKQGLSCLICCAAPMLAMITLGAMNPLVMVLVAVVITVEKVVPRPEPFVRMFGVLAVVMGIGTIVRFWFA